MTIPPAFTKWWKEHGQFVRAGGGQYEISFAFAAWNASRREALEEAFTVCNDIAVDRWNLYKGHSPYTGSEDGRANPYVEGESDGAEKCAEAIRALSQKTAQGETNG
ncbi:hypothetical protein [Paraburkholderia antibiotica]|uniref:Uncharacterized protein n=1 Tax=Paraburkholderia antibiotica TaxID=2728839 RepID=A0A7Y0A1Q5_9BURK|nr:hypothetical protein [Paraburkholderia antibiotica]NML34882.1 hypothetical protein [Paraburkholderia antibiotica]